MNIGQVLETHLGWAASRLGFRAITPVFDGATEEEIEAELARAWMIDQPGKTAEVAWDWLKDRITIPTSIEDDDEVRRLYLETGWVIGVMMLTRSVSDVNYARRSVLREWLRDHGYDPDQMLAFEDVESA